MSLDAVAALLRAAGDVQRPRRYPCPVRAAALLALMLWTDDLPLTHALRLSPVEVTALRLPHVAHRWFDPWNRHRATWLAGHTLDAPWMSTLLGRGMDYGDATDMLARIHARACVPFSVLSLRLTKLPGDKATSRLLAPPRRLLAC